MTYGSLLKAIRAAGISDPHRVIKSPEEIMQERLYAHEQPGGPVIDAEDWRVVPPAGTVVGPPPADLDYVIDARWSLREKEYRRRMAQSSRPEEP